MSNRYHALYQHLSLVIHHEICFIFMKINDGNGDISYLTSSYLADHLLSHDLAVHLYLGHVFYVFYFDTLYFRFPLTIRLSEQEMMVVLGWAPVFQDHRILQIVRMVQRTLYETSLLTKDWIIALAVFRHLPPCLTLHIFGLAHWHTTKFLRFSDTSSCWQLLFTFVPQLF